ncbi:MAG: D-2-hydroxyacid dehydrogenase [Betaproteobacteria bacterium]|jgi:glycerate dehydrogenase|nr:D-2-hydroxyacid dehydrogenase [Betaproteobacteria bacterium]NCU94510.1 D-2-hydroxyacid dehydrogenase [Betaproteobacteria bacterium]
MEHVVFLDRQSLKANVRRPSFEHTWEEHVQTLEADVVTRLKNATVAITNKVPIRKATLEQLPNLKMIAVAATGYDVIDVAACRERGVGVANIRNYAVHTVPEHSFALIFALRRNIIAYRDDVLRGRWQAQDQFCFFDHSISDLYGSTLGIFGEGALGQGTANIARALGMRVLFADHPPPKAPDVEFTDPDTVLAESDIISLHCPLTPESRNFIGLEQFRKMKRTAILINTARGGLVDEAALKEALETGLIAGAGFDVLTKEPPKDGNPLLDIKTPNFILTPHVAWASDGAMQFLADQLIDNVEAYIAGKPQHLVT